MYESEDKMVSHPEHYMSKTGMEAFLLSLKTERLLCLEKQLMNYSEMWLSLIMR